MVRLISLSTTGKKGKEAIHAIFSTDSGLEPIAITPDSDLYESVRDYVFSAGDVAESTGEDLYLLMSNKERVLRKINTDDELSKNLLIENGAMFFGEYEVEDTLMNHILSLLDEENKPKDSNIWSSYMMFLDNLHQNVNEDVRNQLYRWMEYENQSGNPFGITEDGHFVGYKGCEGTLLEPTSVFSGYAIVNGEDFNGKIPNNVGNVIEMPRSMVQCDPGIGCSHGLHVGTRDYATNWSNILTLVKVNPRDVVSVPYECDSQKIRVCRYEVMRVIDKTDLHEVYYVYEDEELDLLTSEDEDLEEDMV